TGTNLSGLPTNQDLAKRSRAFSQSGIKISPRFAASCLSSVTKNRFARLEKKVRLAQLNVTGERGVPSVTGERGVPSKE
ncbi:MAG TPA: hypothetical protein VNH19_19920, partial [Candidatus Limnocylindrales bacterium]|nr:hypothetical protein [Candidatus Limnocylindrales bacterium]